MNILFIHQNFPGQYLHIAKALGAQGAHQLVGLYVHQPGQASRQMKGIRLIGYRLRRSSSTQVHPWASDLEAKIIRGEACAEAVEQLLSSGFKPNLICVHSGWGEGLFLKDICPDVPILMYQEFYYRSKGFDLDFDSEFVAGKSFDWRGHAKARCKTANLLMNIGAADWGVTPTHFQHSTFPNVYQSGISVIHDGIDLERISKYADTSHLILPGGLELTRGEPIVTFVNRCLEPYRGVHTLLRAIPEIQRLCPDAQIVIVGSAIGVSYGSPCPNGEWKDFFLKEIEGQYDPSRVHFIGRLSYDILLQLFRLSAVHIYLTYPFVLSWSLLEALASGCAVVGSATPPVEEVISHGVNGLLVDFFNPIELANAVGELLSSPERRLELGERAKATARKYGLSTCLPRQIALLDMVASRSLNQWS